MYLQHKKKQIIFDTTLILNQAGAFDGLSRSTFLPPYMAEQPSSSDSLSPHSTLAGKILSMSPPGARLLALV